jgi:hypothetical protein
MKKVSIEVPDKVYDVANALRRSYYEDEMKDLVGSKHPLQWVRMAEAAIKEFEKRPQLGFSSLHVDNYLPEPEPGPQI